MGGGLCEGAFVCIAWDLVRGGAVWRSDQAGLKPGLRAAEPVLVVSP